MVALRLQTIIKAVIGKERKVKRDKNKADFVADSFQLCSWLENSLLLRKDISL